MDVGDSEMLDHEVNFAVSRVGFPCGGLRHGDGGNEGEGCSDELEGFHMYFLSIGSMVPGAGMGVELFAWSPPPGAGPEGWRWVRTRISCGPV
jgi:hypothetical protein